MSRELEIEVHGGSIGAIIDGFRFFPRVAMKYLLKYGIGNAGPTGDPVLDRESWYPQEKWLAAHRAIAAEVGSAAMYNIGVEVPKNAVWPAAIYDLDTAIQSIDVAYHLNHRRDGVVMFDPETGKKLDGIGHYGYARAPNERKIVSVCDNPYPCDFDQGLLTGVTARYAPRARVVHAAGACRKKGELSCTYIITW